MTTQTSDSRLVPVMQYETPTTGATINVGTNGNVKLLINPSGSLLNLTLSLPSAPSDGDLISFCSSQIVTTFTMTNGTIIGALTTLAVATFASYIYSATASK